VASILKVVASTRSTDPESSTLRKSLPFPSATPDSSLSPIDVFVMNLPRHVDNPGVLVSPGERAMREWIVANPVATSLHVARDREGPQVEDNAIAHQATILVRRNRIAAATTDNAADYRVLVDVDDLIPQPVEPRPTGSTMM
jgi:hypothetical protein